MRHVGAAAARAVRLSAATVGNQRAAVRGVGRGGVELTLRKRRLTQRCGSLPAQLSAFMGPLPAFLRAARLWQKRPPHVFARKTSRFPQPSLPASQEWRYTLVTNEDTNNTPGRACRRPKPHKPSAPVDVRPVIIDAAEDTVEQPGRRLLSKRFAARERRRAWDTPAPRVSGPDPAPRPTLVAVEVFGPRAARLDPDSAQLPRG